MQLEGRESFIIFLWPGQGAPLIVPYSSCEKFFREATPALDGQYKVQSVLTDIGIRQGYSIWVPANNRNGLDRSICGEVQDGGSVVQVTDVGHAQKAFNVLRVFK